MVLFTRLKCQDCNDNYTGETHRQLSVKLHVHVAEHSKSIRDRNMSSGTSEHTIKTNHSVNLDDLAIKDNENRYYTVP